MVAHPGNIVDYVSRMNGIVINTERDKRHANTNQQHNNAHFQPPNSAILSIQVATQNHRKQWAFIEDNMHVQAHTDTHTHHTHAHGYSHH